MHGLTGHDSLSQVGNTLKADDSQLNKESYKINYLRVRRPSFNKDDRQAAQRKLRTEQKQPTKLDGINEEMDESVDYNNSMVEIEDAKHGYVEYEEKKE